MAGEFRSHTTPLANDAVRDYVSGLGAKLAAEFSGGWNYQFEIVQQNTDGATFEPAAFPGGFIFVSRYLIGAAQSEAEFAGMLAHSMEHVEARHWTRNATRQDSMQVGALSGPSVPSMPNGPSLGSIEFQRACERQADYLAAKARWPLLDSTRRVWLPTWNASSLYVAVCKRRSIRCRAAWSEVKVDREPSGGCRPERMERAGNSAERARHGVIAH